jgi:hypothetical protein
MADSLGRFIYEIHTQEITCRSRKFNGLARTFPLWAFVESIRLYSP